MDETYAATVLFTILAMCLWVQPITAVLTFIVSVVIYLQMPLDD